MERALYQGKTKKLEKGSNSYSILETVSFFTDQLREIQMAQNRVWIQTMALEPGHFTDLFVQRLIAAQHRGVDVRIVHDSFSDYVTDNTFNHLPLLNSEDREYKRFLLNRRVELLELLKGCCQVSQTNAPTGILSYTPFPGVSGRDHKKISIIDNIAYIGGVNMTPLDGKRIDFMLKMDNKDLINILSLIFNRSFLGISVSDAAYTCDDNNTLLVDSGKRSQSIIMQYAYDAIKRERESITVISPYLPSGHLRKTLNEAVERGLNVDVITSQESRSGFSPKISQLVHNVGQVRPLFRIIRYPGILHAKALLLGNHAAIIGSHNFDGNIEPNMPLDATIKKIHKQMGFAIIAHPNLARRSSVPLGLISEIINSGDPELYIDGIEIYNASEARLQRFDKSGIFFGDDDINIGKFVENNKHNPKIGAFLGGSDSHTRQIGYGITVYGYESILDAIKNRDTLVMAADTSFLEDLSESTRMVYSIIRSHIAGKI
ncbi:hypothetical protein AUK04_01420 [Candidatus Roizmanbacteria bacterium CG2_30_33_16]|uniref:PLD phosphodiesterase domain-containing protein n=6 Tax=Candidatus Roizmaniibacteriota TaxID=1752723 RepID=A0A2M7E5I3_9BACT|nr:hypothetical protein [Candidatus Roizmanbacteria bacterium]OIP85195.1 MAG: hypothetical protein AUK04_01420 [Candidatus Roizmanbacteria bacterium CG2_30_33_16]PIV62986.1 MAG: hypothetical protein COS12_00360 [Candidatus Roizmanbacteria bacterium CG01_land_8_20_14_3_00_33_9]PIX74454.1 MAG: hypothetical protein COZ39_00400 [Candidatus Roizmanbacteria bacterium CG_4_10_14_3_um_filter_33_21]PJB88140.1 MAG: hypothetical protein CO083_03290 [Candidatus Roizmanbacteria bacterium CG_4_9_14_0_8_um_fi